MKNVKIYTDGSCKGNPGPGGWAAILIYGDIRKVISGGEIHTSNNRMELLAVIKGLLALKQPVLLEIVTDSKYVINAFTENWIGKWQRNGWKTAGGDVKNKDLWQELIPLVAAQLGVTWRWVKGHSGDPDNDRVDELAQAEALAMKNNR